MSTTQQNAIWYPDAEFVEAITTALVPILFHSYESETPDFQFLGGQHGKGLLESALARPKPLFGQDRYPSVADKAAALIWGIIKNHPFNDGNKRAAITTGFCFLMVNRYFVVAKQDETVKLCLGIASNDPTHDEEFISAWIEARIIRSESLQDISSQRELPEQISGISSNEMLAWITFYEAFAEIARKIRI